MSIRMRALYVGSFLLQGACFNPGSQLTSTTGGTSGDPTTDGPATVTAGASTGTDTTTTTTPTSTTSPTSTDTSATTATSVGGCSACASPTPYCAPTDECINCEQLSDHGMSCGTNGLKQLCDKDGTGECVDCLATSDCPEPTKCDLGSHTCVQCLTDQDCPKEPLEFCDDGACRRCDAHDDCPSQACELDEHKCFPVDGSRNWYITMGGSASQMGECTERMPCPEIADAFAGIAADDGIYHIVHVAPGTYTKKLQLSTNDKRVAVLGQPGVMLDSAAGDNEVFILLGDTVKILPVASKLFLSRLAITGTGAVAISCLIGEFLGLDEVRMSDFSADLPTKGTSLFANKCTMQIRRSEFLRSNGGLWAADATIILENSIISGMTQAPALKFQTESKLDIRYSTLASQDPLLAGGLLSCPLDNDNMFPGVATIRNSAFLAAAEVGPVDCMGKAIDASETVTTDATIAIGMGNFTVTPAQAMAPLLFNDWANSDLHLVGDGAILKDKAIWKTGDPATDIDGLLRPKANDTPDVAGADLPGQP